MNPGCHKLIPSWEKRGTEVNQSKLPYYCCSCLRILKYGESFFTCVREPVLKSGSGASATKIENIKCGKY